MSQKKMTALVETRTDEPIRALDPMEHVRLRPGMYLGSVDTCGLNRLVDEMLEHVISQAREYTCTTITLSLFGPQTLQIRDDGAGLPLYKTEHGGHSILGLAMTADKTGGSAAVESHPRARARLALVTAFCRDVYVEVKQEGALWKQHYQRGRKASELTRVRNLAHNEDNGTCLTFAVDDEIFHDHMFDADWIEARLFDLAHILPGLTVAFENHMTGHRATFRFPTGLRHYLAHANRRQKALLPIMSHYMMVRPTPDVHPFELEAALQVVATPSPYTCNFINGVETPEYGMSVSGCLDALRDTLVRHSTVITCEDIPYVLQHVTLVVSLWHFAATQAATGGSTISRDIYNRLYDAFSVTVESYFREHPECIAQLEAIVLKARKTSTLHSEMYMR
jgi:DNA gyrase subunit B